MILSLKNKTAACHFFIDYYVQPIKLQDMNSVHRHTQNPYIHFWSAIANSLSGREKNKTTKPLNRWELLQNMNVQHKLFENKEWLEFDMRSLLADFIGGGISQWKFIQEKWMCMYENWRIRKSHNNLHAFRAIFKLADFFCFCFALLCFTQIK